MSQQFEIERNWKEMPYVCINVLQAHFEENCFRPNLKGRKLRYEDAIPTIDAFTLDPDDQSTQDFFKALPLYSSPALHDHNYADFVTVVSEWVDIADDEAREREDLSAIADEASERASEALLEIVPEINETNTNNSSEHCEVQNEIEIAEVEDNLAVSEKENSFRLLRYDNT